MSSDATTAPGTVRRRRRRTSSASSAAAAAADTQTVPTTTTMTTDSHEPRRRIRRRAAATAAATRHDPDPQDKTCLRTVGDVWLLWPNILDYFRLSLVIIGLTTFHRVRPDVNAGLYVVSHALDLVDGKLARALGQCSLFGACADYTVDILTEALWMFQLVDIQPGSALLLAVAAWTTTVNMVGLVLCVYNTARGAYWKGTSCRPAWQRPMISDTGYTTLGYACVFLYQCYWAAVYWVMMSAADAGSQGGVVVGDSYSLWRNPFGHVPSWWWRAPGTTTTTTDDAVAAFGGIAAVSSWMASLAASWTGLAVLVLAVPALVNEASLVMIIIEQVRLFREPK